MLNNRHAPRRQKGFTIVEIVVVIVVIGVIGVVVNMANSQAIHRAKATDVAKAFQTVEGALTNWHIKQAWSTWKTENELGFPNATYPSATANVQIDWLLGNTGIPENNGLREYLNINDLPARSLGQIRYDNDGDVLGDPCTDVSNGVNLQISNTKQFFTEVDNIIDKGDGQCGKVALCDTSFTCILYRLGTQSTDFKAN